MATPEGQRMGADMRYVVGAGTENEEIFILGQADAYQFATPIINHTLTPGAIQRATIQPNEMITTRGGAPAWMTLGAWDTPHQTVRHAIGNGVTGERLSNQQVKIVCAVCSNRMYVGEGEHKLQCNLCKEEGELVFKENTWRVSAEKRGKGTLAFVVEGESNHPL